MIDSNDQFDSPLFEAKRYDEPSVFTPESLLREARRQKDLPDQSIPDVCVLDPDGDIVRHLVSTGRAEADPLLIKQFRIDDLKHEIGNTDERTHDLADSDRSLCTLSFRICT